MENVCHSKDFFKRIYLTLLVLLTCRPLSMPLFELRHNYTSSERDLLSRWFIVEFQSINLRGSSPGNFIHHIPLQVDEIHSIIRHKCPRGGTIGTFVRDIMIGIFIRESDVPLGPQNPQLTSDRSSVEFCFPILG